MTRGQGSRFADRSQRITLTNEPANASEMRAFVCAFLEASELPTDVIDEVLMAVGEVVANACRHGRDPSGRGHVELRCDYRDRSVSIEVSDDGPGFDVAEVLHTGVPDVLSQGGRGFFLMRQLMDTVDVVSDASGTVVTLKRKLLN